MIVGGYTLELYCDGEGCPRQRPAVCGGNYSPLGEFSAETGEACRRAARRRGWRLDLRAGVAVCPECVKAGRRPPRPAEASASGPSAKAGGDITVGNSNSRE